MRTINISLIPFLNTKPFYYGIKHFKKLMGFNISYDFPSVCAKKVMSGTTDIGLVPAAIIPLLKGYQIITDTCIGSNGNVKSVILVSQSPMKLLKTVYLDKQSVTSVILARVLAEKYWKINVEWKSLKKFNPKKNCTGCGYVFIGDRALKMRDGFSNVYDLSKEWRKYTGYPFVFACWVARLNVSKRFIKSFGNALHLGLENIQKVVEQSQRNYKGVDVKQYLTQCISYKLDPRKISGMNLFWKYAQKYFDGNGKLLL